MQILKFIVGIHLKQVYFPLITTRVKLSRVPRDTNMNISLLKNDSVFWQNITIALFATFNNIHNFEIYLYTFQWNTIGHVFEKLYMRFNEFHQRENLLTLIKFSF